MDSTPVRGWSQVQISAPETGFDDENFCGLPLPLQIDSRTVPQIRLQPHPSTYFSVPHSLVILPFDAIFSDLLAALLNKPQTNK
jgi:hypothetical protein